jgi:hypothetical protein
MGKRMNKEQSALLSERYIETIKTLLPVFEQKGWLDFEPNE